MDELTLPRSVDARLARANASSFPIVTRRQLRTAGVHRNAVRRRVADGRLVPLWPDVFAVGCTPEQLEGDAIAYAAVAGGGPDARLSHTSALHRRGLWSRHDGTIHVSARCFHADVEWCRVRYHRRRVEDLDGALAIGGVATDSAARACCDAARMLTPHQVASVIRISLYEREFTVKMLELELSRRPGRRGARVVRRAIELHRSGSAGTRSASEDELLAHVTPRFGEPLVNVRGAAGPPDHEPDMVWVRERVIVEIDGDQHRDDHERLRDERRDEMLAAMGWTIIRVPYRDVWRAIGGVLRRIESAMQARAR